MSAAGWRLSLAWGRRALLAFALACVGAGAVAAAPSLNILKVRFGGDDSRTRMVIDADAALSTRLAPAEGGPRRIVLSLPAIGPPDVAEGGGRGLVRAWSVRSDSHGARLVLDLAREGRIAHRFLIPPSEGVANYRYVIDVEVASLAAPAAEVAPEAGSNAAPEATPVAAPIRPSAARRVARRRVAEAAAASGTAPSRRARKVVVIDAGHGGHDPGAQSFDANEKDITLAAARALKARLERDGGYKVVMTRDADVFIPLEGRVQIARRAGADLFISLHADSAGPDAETHGASVYTLSGQGETRVTQVLGPHEWFTHGGARGADPAVGQILLDLTQRSTLNRSAAFAGLLIDRVGAAVDLLPRSRRDAGYFVLLAPDVPAALLEMGFISSPLDEARLTDPIQRDKLMDSVAVAIDAYFAGQTTLASR